MKTYIKKGEDEVFPRLIQKASEQIKGFEALRKRFDVDMRTNGRSLNTCISYLRKIAEISLYYNKLPEQMNEPEILVFLDKKIQDARSLSLSEFKHCVYGLRYYFKMIGRSDLSLRLPVIKKEKRLPAVLSKKECSELFAGTKNVKHRTALMFVYAGGLRAKEFTNIKLGDIDSDRMTIHVRGGKGRRDRYVPLSELIMRNLSYYLVIVTQLLKKAPLQE